MASRQFNGIVKSLATIRSEGTMDLEQQVDGITKLLAESQTRRGALRLLTGAVLAGGLGMSGRADILANKEVKRCRTGRSWSRHSIHHVNKRYKTSVLEQRRLYRIRVSGYVVLGEPVPGPWGPSSPALDAEYAFDAFHPNAFTDKDTETSAGTDYGVSIDGKKPNWGPYDPDSHTYEQVIKGRGRRLSLMLQAHRGSISRQSSMVVEISCA
jgi:hypothetical protein